MSESILTCQIGFGYRDEPGYVYYHVEGDETLGYEFKLSHDILPQSYDVEDLIEGTIPYALLPEVIKDLIETFAHMAYQTICLSNPTEASKLDLESVEAVFHRKNV